MESTKNPRRKSLSIKPPSAKSFLFVWKTQKQQFFSQIGNKISTATLTPQEEAELIKELESIAQLFPLLTFGFFSGFLHLHHETKNNLPPHRKLNERERMGKEIDSLWKQVHEITRKVEELEKSIANFNASPNPSTTAGVATPTANEEQKQDRKSVLSLKQQIEKLYTEKRRVKSEHDAAFKRYKEQQYQFQQAKLVAKRKQELFKLRVKEEKEKKLRLAKCQELIDKCEQVMTKYHKVIKNEENPQATDAAKKAKDKKKKKKKQKKAEILVTALELDTLKEDFATFNVVAPTGKADLGNAIKALYGKLKEIDNKPLSEAIPLHPHKWTGEDNESIDGISGTSFSPNATEDLGEFEHSGD